MDTFLIGAASFLSDTEELVRLVCWRTGFGLSSVQIGGLVLMLVFAAESRLCLAGESSDGLSGTDRCEPEADAPSRLFVLDVRRTVLEPPLPIMIDTLSISEPVSDLGDEELQSGPFSRNRSAIAVGGQALDDVLISSA